MNFGKGIYRVLTNPSIFSLIYMTLTVLRSFPLLGDIFDWPVRICTAWSILLIGYLLITRKRLKAMPGILIGIVMLGCFCISLIVNASYVFYSGAKLVLYNGIYVLLLYVQASVDSFAEIKKTLKKMNSILIGIGMVAAIASIIMFCFNIGFRVTISGTSFRQGLMETRLFGVYSTPNTGALLALITVVASMINNLIDRGGFFRFNRFYIINGILQLLYFSMTISYGGYLTYFTMLILFCLVIILPRLLEKGRVLSGLLKTAGIMVAGVVVLVGVCFAINKCMVYIPRATSDLSFVKAINEKIDVLTNGTDSDLPGDDSEDENDEPNLDRVHREGDMSDGRIMTWKAVLHCWSEAPLLGVSDGRIYLDGEYRCRVPESKLSDADIYRLKEFGNQNHNVYIQTLFYSGIIGLAAFLTFCIYNVVIHVRFLKNASEKNEIYKLVGILFCIAAGFAANGIVETHLLFNYYDPFGAIFWMYLGFGAVLAVRFHKTKRFEQ